MLDSPHEHWKQTLLQRWSRCFARHGDRIVWMPRMGRPQFLQLLTLADVMLDPIHFGGGNTNYEALAYGVPIVTLPSEFLRGRVASGLYRLMGIADCVADTTDDYIDKAISLANNTEFRTDCRERILASSHRIFDDDSAVRELEQFWIAATVANHRQSASTL